MSLAMRRIGPNIVPITFPTPGRYATYYDTDAGSDFMNEIVHFFGPGRLYHFLCFTYFQKYFLIFLAPARGSNPAGHSLAFAFIKSRLINAL